MNDDFLTNCLEDGLFILHLANLISCGGGLALPLHPKSFVVADLRVCPESNAIT